MPATTARLQRVPAWVPWAHAVAATALIAAAILRAPSDSWDVSLLAVLAALAIGSDLFAVDTDARLRISGNSLALVLAAVLLGPTPAALLGLATIAVGWFKWREQGHYLRNNLVAFAAFPFLAGLGFHAAVSAAGLTPDDAGFYALVVPTYFVSVALNFVLVAGYKCLLDGSSLWHEARRTFMLLLTSEMLCAVLTAGIAWLAVQVGVLGLAFVTVALIAFQHVVGELLVSRERGEQLRIQSVTDPLTGLPNRLGFTQQTDAALGRATDRGERLGVLLMDLDRFKDINDTLGHHIGDLVLAEVGSRVRSATGEDVAVARLSGDEFALLVTADPDRGRIVDVAGAVTSVLEAPFDVADLSLEIAASIGIAHFPADGEDVNELLQRADVAMYAAKDDGSDFEVYQPERDRHSTRRLALTSDLRAAIARAELDVVYHPEIEIATESVVGVEALARWAHPSLGDIRPVEFIELAEQTGLIRPLTELVLDQALEQARRWREDELDLDVAVNLSARSLSDRNLPDQVLSQLRDAGMRPERLSLEITETMLLRDPARALDTLQRLHDAGVRISIDDFGTGYSSLAYLKELPLDEIKVDRSFVSGMVDDATDAVIVRSTVELGRSLELRTVAEGVEDADTLALLRRINCSVAQGFHFTRPVPGDELLRWVAGRVVRGSLQPESG